MKSIGEALREMVPYFDPIGTARTSLLHALGAVLAEDVVARVDLPPFDNSAMDGYAVRHADLSPGLVLPLIGESRAGGPAPSALRPGSVMRIFTGAPLPAGADSVVIQENAQQRPTGIVFDPMPKKAANVRLRASDVVSGSVALPRGQALGPGEIGLLAALGRHGVTVYRRPRVAIVSTGDELRDIGEADAPGTIVNSNAYALAAQVADAGAEPWVLPIASDRRDDICEKLAQALHADAVLSTGGVSVGDYDLVGQALQASGVELKLWKVAIKPGKPLLFGMAGRVPVVGLPGNPVSAMVTFEVFVRPGLRRMLGHANPYPSLIDVELELEHGHATGRTELCRARLSRGSDGRLRGRPVTLQGSGSLPSMCGIDALLVLDARVAHFPEGSVVPALLLRAAGGQAEPPFS